MKRQFFLSIDKMITNESDKMLVEISLSNVAVVEIANLFYRENNRKIVHPHFLRIVRFHFSSAKEPVNCKFLNKNLIVLFSFLANVSYMGPD